MIEDTFVELKRRLAGESAQTIKSRESLHCYVIKIGNTANLQTPQQVNRLQQILQSVNPVQRYRLYKIECQTPFNEKFYHLNFKQRCKNHATCKVPYVMRLTAEMRLEIGEEQAKKKFRAIGFIKEGGQGHFEQPVESIGLENIVKQTKEEDTPTAKLFLKQLYSVIESQLEVSTENSQQRLTPKEKANFFRNGHTQIEFLQQILNQINETEEVVDAQDLRSFLAERLDQLAAPLINREQKLPSKLLFECFAANFCTMLGFDSQEFQMHTYRQVPRKIGRYIVKKNDSFKKRGYEMLDGLESFDEEQYHDFLIFEYPVFTALIMLLPKALKMSLLDHNIDYWMAHNKIKSNDRKLEVKDEVPNELQLRQAKAAMDFEEEKQTLEFGKEVDDAIRNFVLRKRPAANAEISATKLFEDSQNEVIECEKKLLELKIQRQKLDHDIELTAQELRVKQNASKKLFRHMFQFKQIRKISRVVQNAENVTCSDYKEQLEAEVEANTKNLSETEEKLLSTLMSTPKPKQDSSLSGQPDKNHTGDAGKSLALSDPSNITGLGGSNVSTEPMTPPAQKSNLKNPPTQAQQLKQNEIATNKVAKKLEKVQKSMGGVIIRANVHQPAQ